MRATEDSRGKAEQAAVGFWRENRSGCCSLEEAGERELLLDIDFPVFPSFSRQN